MDKEGQPVQFSSDKIPEKEKPDFFIASNDKPPVGKKLGLDKVRTSQKSFFKNLGSSLANFLKHPFQGNHKIISILAIILIVVLLILLVLSLTVWRSTEEKDYSPLSEEALTAWRTTELPQIISTGAQTTDEEAKSYYAELISNERTIYRTIDLTIEYARELAYRGFVDQALGLLDAIDVDDMECMQVVALYEAYQFVYYMMGNQTASSQTEYYGNLAIEQEGICITEATGLEVDLSTDDEEEASSDDNSKETQNEE